MAIGYTGLFGSPAGNSRNLSGIPADNSAYYNRTGDGPADAAGYYNKRGGVPPSGGGFYGPNPDTSGRTAAYGNSQFGNMFSGNGQNGQGFQTLNNVKSGSFQGGIDNFLSGVNGQTFNPNVNPNVLRDNTKNGAIQSAVNSFTNNLGGFTNPYDITKSGQFAGAINQGFGQQAADSSTNRGSLSQYMNLFNTQTPGVNANVGQENNAISRTYNGGLQNDLQNNANAENAAINLSTQRALGTVGKNNALMRMQGGDSSYANQQGIDTAAGIYASAAQRQAELQRNNLLYVQGQQTALNGVRNQNLGYAANRQLQPINALTSLTNTENSQIGNLGGMTLSNNIYTTPQEQGQARAGFINAASSADVNNNFYNTDSAQANQARQLAQFGELQAANNANNFYGLQGQYNPSVAGLLGNGQPNSRPTPNYFSNPGSFYPTGPTETPQGPVQQPGLNGYGNRGQDDPLYWQQVQALQRAAYQRNTPAAFSGGNAPTYQGDGGFYSSANNYFNGIAGNNGSGAYAGGNYFPAGGAANTPSAPMTTPDYNVY